MQYTNVVIGAPGNPVRSSACEPTALASKAASKVQAADHDFLPTNSQRFRWPFVMSLKIGIAAGTTSELPLVVDTPTKAKGKTNVVRKTVAHPSFHKG